MTHAEDVYLFRHGLLRDAAYNLQPPSERAALHLLAVECLGEDDTTASDVADHFRQAQEGTDAARVEALRIEERRVRERAATFAATRHATTEVVEHMLRLADLPQPDVKSRIAYLVRAGAISMSIGRLADAESIAKRMLDLAREAGDPVQEARSLRALMAVEVTDGRVEAAERHLNESLAILQQHGDKVELSATLRAFALHAVARGRYNEAQSWIDRAMHLSDDNPRERALLLNTAGTMLDKMDRHAEALEAFQQSMKLHVSLGQSGKARECRNNAAACLLELGRLDEAEAEARSLLEEFTKAGNLSEINQARGVLAAIESRRGHHSSAAALYEEILQQELAMNRVFHALNGHALVAEELCHAGRFDEAIPHIDRVMSIGKEQGSLTGIARAHWLRGWVHEAKGNWAEAERELTIASKMQEELRETSRQEAIRERLARVRLKVRHPEQNS